MAAQFSPTEARELTAGQVTKKSGKEDCEMASGLPEPANLGPSSRSSGPASWIESHPPAKIHASLILSALLVAMCPQLWEAFSCVTNCSQPAFVFLALGPRGSTVLFRYYQHLIWPCSFGLPLISLPWPSSCPTQPLNAVHASRESTRAKRTPSRSPPRGP